MGYKTGSVAGEVNGKKQYEQSTADNFLTYHKSYLSRHHIMVQKLTHTRLICGTVKNRVTSTETWSVAGEVSEKQSYDRHTANIFSNQDEFVSFCQQRQVPTFQRCFEPRGGVEFKRTRRVESVLKIFDPSKIRYFGVEKAPFS